MVGGTESAQVLAGLVRIDMDWSLEIACSSGLLELFVLIVLGRLISRARSVAVGWEADTIYQGIAPGPLLTTGYRDILLVTRRWKGNASGEHGHKTRSVIY
jgi:hypothetical protein